MKKIVIVGGGTAGWMTAASLCHVFEGTPLETVIVESEQIGSVGVGEATIPHLRYFNERLGINEHEFMRETRATYKIGIEFSNWGRLGDSYIHPFGEFGFKTDGLAFYHYWLKAASAGYSAPLEDFSLPVAMAKNNKFAYPLHKQRSIYSTYSYAFHIDASRYAGFLRKYCEQKAGADSRFRRVEGRITQVDQDDSGDICGLHLQDGRVVSGDFFIDCSGFRALLLNESLAVDLEDWSHWLPCDRAIAVPTASVGPPPPFTRAIARDAGWQWKIPLQHRTGNGLVYSSAYMDDEEAAKTLTDNIEGEQLASLNFLKFTTGRRKKSWANNCVAIGLSSGFLEPLESTSIYLIQAAIMKLTDLLPSGPDYSLQREEFNRQMSLEYERIRDFLILHYHATERDDTPFWSYCKNMNIPDSLRTKMAAFKHSGYIATYDQGLFFEPSWAAVYFGQRVVPAFYHRSAARMEDAELIQHLDLFRAEIAAAAMKMPNHEKILTEHCASESSEAWPKASLSLYGVFS